MKIIEETKKHIEIINKPVSWIGSEDREFALTKTNFFKLKEEEYDAGYGSQEIATDLIIVFKDGSHSNRYEYDGSESWEHHELKNPTFPKNAKPFTKVRMMMWQQLGEQE